MKPLLQLGTTLVLVVVAGVAGYLLAGGPRPPAASPGERTKVIAVSPAAQAGGGVRLDEVRAIVREELASARPAPAQAPKPETAAPEPEVAAQVAAAHDQLEQAIAQGVWTDADRRTFSVRLAGLPHEERRAILGRMMQAINDGTLHVAAGTTPL